MTFFLSLISTKVFVARRDVIEGRKGIRVYQDAGKLDHSHALLEAAMVFVVVVVVVLFCFFLFWFFVCLFVCFFMFSLLLIAIIRLSC